MIYIVEAYVEDYFHVLANANIIKIFRNIYKGEQITFLSSRVHNDSVKSYFKGQDGLTFDSFENLSLRTGNIFQRAFSILSRIFRDFFLLRKIFKKCKADDVVVITHIYFPSLILLKLIKKLYPQITTFSVIHGDVEYVFWATTTYHKIMGFFHKLMFKINAKKFYYIFLTPVSKDFLDNSERLMRNEMFSIELPTFPNETYNSQINDCNDLTIGHIGSAGTRKNVQLFYHLANKLQDMITSGKLHLRTIGVLENTIKPYLNQFIVNYVDNEIGKLLKRELYDKKISELSYSIFFYGKHDFILRSSAAFFDALYYEKPIIALRNTFFEDVFLRNGSIGYLCNDVDEMAEVIELISTGGEEVQTKYCLMIENIKKYKLKLSIEAISLELAEDLNKIKLI